MANRLANETSPYLLQHKDNPVAWYPWGEEALGVAKDENRPILLSIGYAACHWCHVMEHESFEDDETAAIMNKYFVNIKVDREERPDLDTIYMAAVQAITGRGGWPMTVFLTPDGEPFYGGTYFPPTPRYGMPSFKQVLLSVAGSWEKQPEDIVRNARGLATNIENAFDLAGQNHVLDPLLFDRVLEQYELAFDKRWGGFSKQGPKFPPSMTLEFLLRLVYQTGDESALEMAQLTLDKMAQGGMYDQIGGGFARYSVDERWHVPHFEKMLYDNGPLARVYLHAWQMTKKPLYKQVVEETLDWTLLEMTHESGGFYSSLDADSEGEEGKFYVWETHEVEEILGEDARLFMRYYDVTVQGNWEHTNVLQTLHSLEDVSAEFNLTTAAAADILARSRQAMYAARAERIWPGLDNKVLTAWNGLMLSAFAEAGRVLKRDDYLAAAIKNAAFIWNNLRLENGRLLRTWKAGSTGKLNAYLEDYAYLAEGLLTLYAATGDDRWFVWAHELADIMLAQFQDAENGGFFDTSVDHEQLLFRPKTLQDNATPSANSVATRVLILLTHYTGDRTYSDYAEEMVSALYPAMIQYPTGFGQWLSSAWLLLSEPKEVAIVGGEGDLVDLVWGDFRPNIVLAHGPSEQVPLLANRPPIDKNPTAYVCENFTCQRPVTDAAALKAQLTSGE